MELDPESSSEFAKALTAYETIMRMVQITDRAQSVYNKTKCIKTEEINDIFQQIFDKTVSYSDKLLARLITVPASNLAEATLKLKYLLDEHYTMPRGETIYDADDRHPFSPEAALARIADDLEGFAKLIQSGTQSRRS